MHGLALAPKMGHAAGTRLVTGSPNAGLFSYALFRVSKNAMEKAQENASYLRRPLFLE
jgi:hypothetical protein